MCKLDTLGCSRREAAGGKQSTISFGWVKLGTMGRTEMCIRPSCLPRQWHRRHLLCRYRPCRCSLAQPDAVHMPPGRTAAQQQNATAKCATAAAVAPPPQPPWGIWRVRTAGCGLACDFAVGWAVDSSTVCDSVTRVAVRSPCADGQQNAFKLAQRWLARGVHGYHDAASQSQSACARAVCSAVAVWEGAGAPLTRTSRWKKRKSQSRVAPHFAPRFTKSAGVRRCTWSR